MNIKIHNTEYLSELSLDNRQKNLLLQRLLRTISPIIYDKCNLVNFGNSLSYIQVCLKVNGSYLSVFISLNLLTFFQCSVKIQIQILECLSTGSFHKTLLKLFFTLVLYSFHSCLIITSQAKHCFLHYRVFIWQCVSMFFIDILGVTAQLSKSRIVHL